MKHSALRDAWTGGSGENKTLFSQQKIYIQFTPHFLSMFTFLVRYRTGTGPTRINTMKKTCRTKIEEKVYPINLSS